MKYNQNESYGIEVISGRLANHIGINKFGRNPDIDVGTEDIWSQGGTWVAPTTARVHNIKSSSVNDTAAGTGARTLTVYGLNELYVEVSESITLNGTTDVATTNSYVIIHRMIVNTAGSGGTNAGTITATAVTDATVTIGIVIGKGQTQLCVYQIPAGYTGYITSFGASIQGASGSNVLIELFVKPLGGIFNLKNTIHCANTGSTWSHHDFDLPISCPEKSIIKLTGTSDSANSDVAGNFEVVLIKDE